PMPSKRCATSSLWRSAVQQVTGEHVELASVDQGSTGEAPAQAAAAQGIQLAVVELPEAKRGFVLLPRRWVVERDFAWSCALHHGALVACRAPPQTTLCCSCVGHTAWRLWVGFAYDYQLVGGTLLFICSFWASWLTYFAKD